MNSDKEEISNQELKIMLENIEDINRIYFFTNKIFSSEVNFIDLLSFKNALFSFENCTFNCSIPKNEKNDLLNIDYFKNCTFNKSISLQERIMNTDYFFQNCTFNNIVFIENQKKFSGDKLFLDCKFPKYICDKNEIEQPNINILNTTFITPFKLLKNEIHHILIRKTIFKKPIMILEELKLNSLVIGYSTLKDGFQIHNEYKKDLFFLNKMIFAKCVVNGKFIARNCKIIKLDFEHTTFNDKLDLFGSELDNTEFENSVFNNIAIFEHVVFNDDVNFKFTTFGKLVSFKNAHFKKELNLEDSIIENKMNFLQTNNTTINVANRETARIIKDSFEQQNNIMEANKFYALEMKKREKELDDDLKKCKNFFEWLVFKIHGISSNHSQSYLLPLFWMVVISFMYILFSTKFNLIESFLYNLMIKNILDEIVNLVNPFPMASKSPMTFGLLLYKITIAYLIYQFIISIRQNTRRK